MNPTPATPTDRRDFLATSALAALAGIAGTSSARAQSRPAFTLAYAPHFGMFRHSAPGGPLDEIRFAHEQGFRAWEDNRMGDRPVEQQEAIASLMEEFGMRMGVVSAKTGINELNFASRDEEARQVVLDKIEATVEVAKRVNAGYMTLVSGQVDPRWPREIQYANGIELLRRAVEIVEPHDITLVMEPLNRFTNHPGSFLQTVTEGYLLCEAVDHPNCKVLYDIYHQQIAGGNLIPLFDLCRDQIAGEINYAEVFRHLHESGWDGIVGMEHGVAGQGADGEEALVAAYRSVDPG